MGNNNCCEADSKQTEANNNLDSSHSTKKDRSFEVESKIRSANPLFNAAPAPYNIQLAKTREQFKPMLERANLLIPGQLNQELERLLLQTPKSWAAAKDDLKSLLKIAHLSFGGKKVSGDLRMQEVKMATGTYYGQANEGAPNGFGKLLTSDGKLFVGWFLKGVLHGPGLSALKRGNNYYFQGEFVDGKITCKEGRIFDKALRLKYVGEFKNDTADGRGMEELDDGSLYLGNYSQGIKHNYAKLFWGDGSIYIGDHVDCVKEGEGVYYAAGKGVYRGGWREDEMDGPGEYRYGDGSVYIGYYSRGLKEGEGVVTRADGVSIEGRFCKGEYSGDMRIHTPDGKIVTKHIN